MSRQLKCFSLQCTRSIYFTNCNFQLFLELNIQGFSHTTFCNLSECHVQSSGNALLDMLGHDGRFHDVKGIPLGREFIVTSLINWNQMVERLSSNSLLPHRFNKDHYTLYSPSVFSLAENLQLILGNSATYRLFTNLYLQISE